MSDTFLPYGRQRIDDADVEAVVGVLRGNLLTCGAAVPAFENALATLTGARRAVACANGTAALHLCALALELGRGDAVIVPSLTFLATANAARFVGAEVVFADVDPGTGLMTADHLAEALTRCHGLAPKAVFPVHLNGQSCDMVSLSQVARAAGLAIVEDACHALGGSYRDDPVGSCRYGDMTCFSFHPVKVATMGEGGAVTTNSDELAQRLMLSRSHGMVRDAGAFKNASLAFDEAGDPNPWYYEMPELGFNYRASDINCALGQSQLSKLGAFVARRRQLAAHYDALLQDLHPLAVPVPRMPGGEGAFHLYAVYFDFAAMGVSRARFMRALAAEGIGSQVHYLPVHLQPYYRARYGEMHLDGAWRYYQGILSLPLFPAMEETDVDRVVSVIRKIADRSA